MAILNEHTSDTVPLAEFAWDAEGGIFVHPGHRGFAYSDGEAAEQRIRHALAGATDRSLFSAELQAHIVDWPSEYHLSEMRHNLLRHIPIGASDSVLELGAGCGAVTRQFGEAGAQVDAIEGSRLRAECASLRCAGQGNVRVYCSDFQQIAFDRTYNYVTLIGVLEYSPVFFGGADPFGACLALARSALRPGGTLIIAIENRLGLKYLLGFGEDHVGKAYFGVQDLYGPRTPKTLGRIELEQAVRAAGFGAVEFHYPFPDYKLPKVVVTEQGFQSVGFAPGEIVRQLRSRDYLSTPQPLVHERLVWPSVAANALLPALANSFLLLATDEGTADLARSTMGSDVLLAVTYSLERRRACKTVTRFTADPTGAVRADKRRLIPSAAPLANDEPSLVSLRVEASPYIAGMHLGSEMIRRLVQRDEEGFSTLARAWIGYAREHGIADAGAGPQSAIIGEFFDCIPGNLILCDGAVHFIDREWILNGRGSLAALVVRGLFSLFMTSDIDLVLPPGETLRHCLASWVGRLGMPWDDAVVEEFIRLESALVETAQGGGENTRQYIERSLARKSGASSASLPMRAVRLARRKLRSAFNRARGR